MTTERRASRVRVHPGALAGRVRVPGDKSLSHRALLLGALADGECEVAGLAPSADVTHTAAALRLLGARVELAADPESGQLGGRVAGSLGEATDVLDCGNSGTAIRLLTGLVAGRPGLTVLTGDGSLRQRPMDRIREPLRRMGADIDARAGGRLAPLVVRGAALRAVDHTIPVASAQVKSAILLAGLHADGRTSVTAPAPSRDHTERLVAYLGGEVSREIDEQGAEHVRLSPGPLRSRSVTVSGDPSSAAFWLVAGAVGGTSVTVEGLCVNPTRTGVVTVLAEFGAGIGVEPTEELSGEPVGDVSVRPAPLGGAVVAGRTVVDAIDELPVLAVAGALSRDGLEVRDAAELRVKESDRIAAVARTLGALGVAVEEREDGYRVAGGQRPRAGRVDARGDHRIAMTAAIAATVATGPVEIDGFDVVATSYPTFLDDFARLGGRVDVLEAHPAD